MEGGRDKTGIEIDLGVVLALLLELLDFGAQLRYKMIGFIHPFQKGAHLR